MEPISIAASLITVIGLVGKVAKGLKNVQIARGAPAEFLALVNEVSDFQIILDEFKAVLSDHLSGIEESRRDSVHKILQNSTDTLLELEKLIYHRLVKSYDGHGSAKVSRMAWLSNKDEIGSIRLKLKDERNNLALFIASLTSCVLSLGLWS